MLKNICITVCIFLVLTSNFGTIDASILSDFSQKTLIDRWFSAITNNDLDLIKNLIYSVDINAQDKFGCTALMCAAEKDNIALANLLLSIPGINVNLQDNYGNTALMEAIYFAREKIATVLLSLPQTDINIVNKNNFTTLMQASLRGLEHITKVLLQNRSIDVNAQDQSGSTALMLAASRGHESIVTLLLNMEQIDINIQDNKGKNALMWASEKGHENVVRLLLNFAHSDTTPNINAQAKSGATALILAIVHAHEDVVKLLLDAGTDVNIQNIYGSVALIEAATLGNENILRMLLSVTSIKINIQDKDGKTALMHAASHNKQDISKLIQEEINRLSNKAFMAIYLSSKETSESDRNDHLKTVKSAVAQIGDTEVNYQGNTLLHVAFINNAAEIISFLLQNSTDPGQLLDIRNNLGYSALELIPPTSELFKFCVDLAYASEDFTKDSVHKKRKLPGQQPANNCPQEIPMECQPQPCDHQLIDLAEKACANCPKTNCTKRCSVCKTVYYCCVTCQKAHWKVHKRQCTPEIISWEL